MKKLTIIVPYLLLFIVLIFFGAKWIELNQEPRFIEVTGSAEREIEPDEIHLKIGIQEYLNHDYQISSRLWEEPVKTTIDSVENRLFRSLEKLKINRSDLIVNKSGSYRNYQSNEPLINKEFELVLPSVAQVDAVVASCNFPGIQYVNLGEMTSSKISEFRKEVKREAVLAAEEKAVYLLAALDEETAELISLTEVNDGDYQQNFWLASQAVYSNSVLTDQPASAETSIKKIQLRFAFNAKFAIK